jgi:hypothetical protein
VPAHLLPVSKLILLPIDPPPRAADFPADSPVHPTIVHAQHRYKCMTRRQYAQLLVQVRTSHHFSSIHLLAVTVKEYYGRLMHSTLISYHVPLKASPFGLNHSLCFCLDFFPQPAPVSVVLAVLSTPSDVLIQSHCQGRDGATAPRRGLPLLL